MNWLEMIVTAIVALLVSVMLSEVAKCLELGIVVTPSYKVKYNDNGTIAHVRCKRSGKFVAHSKAIEEILSYY